MDSKYILAGTAVFAFVSFTWFYKKNDPPVTLVQETQGLQNREQNVSVELLKYDEA